MWKTLADSRNRPLKRGVFVSKKKFICKKNYIPFCVIQGLWPYDFRCSWRLMEGFDGILVLYFPWSILSIQLWQVSKGSQEAEAVWCGCQVDSVLNWLNFSSDRYLVMSHFHTFQNLGFTKTGCKPNNDGQLPRHRKDLKPWNLGVGGHLSLSDFPWIHDKRFSILHLPEVTLFFFTILPLRITTPSTLAISLLAFFFLCFWLRSVHCFGFYRLMCFVADMGL